MKIAYASDAYYPRTHGVAVCIDSMSNYLAEYGHNIYIISPEYKIKDERTLHDNIKIHRYKSYGLFFTTNKEERFIYPTEIKKIEKLLDEINPDIIHVHLEFFVGYAARNWAKKNNKPLVMTIYTYYPPYLKLYIPYCPKNICFQIAKQCSKWFYKPSDLLFVLTKEIEEVSKKEYGVSNPMKRLLIGINEDDFKNFDKEKDCELVFKRFPYLKNKKVLLFVGRIGEEKNVGFLLQVMHILLKRHNNIELMLVGGGSYIEKFKTQAKNLSIDKHTTFVESIPHTKIKHYYAAGDIFVFPSVTEAQGLVTSEALYLGLPVVAVSALGTKTVLENNIGGFLVEENKEEFANKVTLLLNDRDLYEEKKMEAIERGRELTMAKTFDGVVETYKEVIKNKVNKK